eukprot:GHVU01221554.1.p1 GENE.GHVU01221554.1~~GHVU01221554.1.p1  ORF type:complete len:350 (-),score=56.84 GHVU01221554.1:625-1674(-)
MLPNVMKDAVTQHARKAKTAAVGGIYGQVVACGLHHSLAVVKLDNFPQLYAWGSNQNNVLGIGIETEEVQQPMHVEYFEKSHVWSVSCGTNHSMVIVKKPSEAAGRLYAFGLGSRGRLGFMKEGSDMSAESESWYTPRPFRVKGGEKLKFVAVSCGADHTLAVADSGALYAWGLGQHGALGTGFTEDAYEPQYVSVRKGHLVVSIAAGSRHSVVCTDKGVLFSWGHGGNGRLGLGHSRGVVTPEQVTHLEGTPVAQVAAAESHSACVDASGQVYTWGGGSYGRLGHNDEADVAYPRKVEALGGVAFVQVACGVFHTLALSKSGKVYSWGSGLAVGCRCVRVCVRRLRQP